MCGGGGGVFLGFDLCMATASGREILLRHGGLHLGLEWQ